jgi:argininosuccinate synthase
MPLVELIESLETIAGAHGVGRIDMVENRLVGTKSREIYEAPAGVVLHMAHRELQKLVIMRDLERLSREMSRVYADLVYNGDWFSHTRESIDAFVQRDPAARDRRGPPQAVQGRLPRGRSALAVRALRRRARSLCSPTPRATSSRLRCR